MQIHKFGGDKGQVTIWGSSAGGGSVLQQLIAHKNKSSPSSTHAAITNSAFLPSQYPYNGDIPEVLYDEVIKRTGCSNTDDSFSCLKETGVDILDGVNQRLGAEGFFGVFPFTPVVDGTFIKERVSQAFASGKSSTARGIYAITNADEGFIFVDPTFNGDVLTYIRNLYPKLEEHNVKKAAALYAHFGDSKRQAIKIMGEAVFICPTYYVLPAFKEGSTFKAELATPPAFHGADNQYYFPSSKLPGGSGPPFDDPEFTTAFADTYLAFGLSRDPNRKITPGTITPTWKAWNRNLKEEMLFNRTDPVDGSEPKPDVRVIKTDGELLERCRFWLSVSSQTYQ